MITLSRGFTLIELLITLAIFSFLLALGGQLSRAWVDSAQQRDAAGILKQGIARTKATALRNPQGAQGDAPSAVLCRSGQSLRLFSLADNDTIDCSLSTGALWSAQLPGMATVQAGGTDLVCIAFSNRGLAVTGSNACTTSSIDVTVGSESVFNVSVF